MNSPSGSFACLLLLLFIVYGCNEQNATLSSSEIQQIEADIIKVSEKHASDLVKLDHKEVMKFYARNHIVFGDGFYWGDYETIDSIWTNFIGAMKVMDRWKLRNHKIHVYSKDAASYLVEFDNERINKWDDTTKVVGCFSYGMQKINGEWKAVTTHVSHIYDMNDTTRTKKWWYGYSPGVRK